jgi:hypothetical protein
MGKTGTGSIFQASALALLVIGGCATARSYPPPTNTQLASAERSVKAARDAGAASDPAAGRHLRDAERALADAKRAAAAGDNRGAVMGLARAEVDAEYGHALHLQARAARQADLTEQQLAETRAAPPPRALAPAPAPEAAPAVPARPLPAAPSAPGAAPAVPAPPLPAAPSAPPAN